jgi:hypothetical protein
MQESIGRKIMVQGQPWLKCMALFEKQLAQVVEHLPSKHKAVHSNSGAVKKEIVKLHCTAWSYWKHRASEELLSALLVPHSHFRMSWGAGRRKWIKTL